jgi:TPR repeat protein
MLMMTKSAALNLCLSLILLLGGAVVSSGHVHVHSSWVSPHRNGWMPLKIRGGNALASVPTANLTAWQKEGLHLVPSQNNDSVPLIRMRPGDDAELAKMEAILEREAAAGHARYQYYLGRNYWTRGEKVKALSLMEQAAAADNPSAENFLGECHAKGEITPPSLSVAADLFMKASLSGHLAATKNLADMYFLGAGVEANRTKAINLYKVAAELGHIGALRNLRCCIISNKTAESKMEMVTDTSVEPGQPPIGEMDFDARDALNLYTASSKEGNIAATYCLAVMHGLGVGTDKDGSKASDFAKRAAANGHPAAQFNLAVAYHNGDLNFEKNVTEALRWLDLAVGQKYSSALHRLATLGFKGTDVPKNMTEILRLLSVAAAQGHPESLCFLGDIYSSGVDVIRDLEKAASMYQTSALKGFPEGLRKFALCLMQGQGVPTNAQAAMPLLQAAAMRGDEAASKIMTTMVITSKVLAGALDEPKFTRNAKP